MSKTTKEDRDGHQEYLDALLIGETATIDRRDFEALLIDANLCADLQAQIDFHTCPAPVGSNVKTQRIAALKEELASLKTVVHWAKLHSTQGGGMYEAMKHGSALVAHEDKYGVLQ